MVGYCWDGLVRPTIANIKGKVQKRKRQNKLNKGVWGMPRLSEAKKDVTSCEKLRGSAHTN